MTKPKPIDEEVAPGTALTLAQRHFLRVIDELDRILGDLKTREKETPPAVAKAAVEARRAIQTLFYERKRLDEASKDGAGNADNQSLDLDAARDEIRRRLACLSPADGAGDVSGRVE